MSGKASNMDARRDMRSNEEDGQVSLVDDI